VPEQDRALQTQPAHDGLDVPGVGGQVVGSGVGAVVRQAPTADVEDDRAHQVGEPADDEVHGDRGAGDPRHDHQRGPPLGPVVQEVQARPAREHPPARRGDVTEVGERRLGQDALVGGLGHRSAFRKGSSR
jgi:hypothetical protein